MDGVSAKLLCWSDDPDKVRIASSPTVHFEVPKALCDTAGALKFTAAGADACPLPDDTDVSAVDQLDPTTCLPVGGSGPVTSVAGKTGDVVLDADDITSGTFPAARIPNATGSTPGGIVLAGDLAGTAASPTVPGLSGKANDADVLHKTGNETASGIKELTSSLIVTSNTVTNRGLVIQRVGTVGTSDGELFAVLFNGELITILNEKGNPRFHRGTGSSEVIMKMFVDGNNVHDILQIFLVGDTVTPSARIGGGGGLFFPRLTTTSDVSVGGALAVTGNSVFTGAVTVPTPVAATSPATKAYADGIVDMGASDWGYLAWNWPIFMAPGGTLLSTNASAGQLTVIRVPIHKAMTVNNIHMYITAAGSGLTAGNNFAGLYSSSGAKLAATVDQSTNWASTGMANMALASAQAVSGTHVYVALFFNGTTSPTFARANNTAVANLGRTGAAAFYAKTSDTGLTNAASLPANLGTFTEIGVSFGVALS